MNKIGQVLAFCLESAALGGSWGFSSEGSQTAGGGAALNEQGNCIKLFCLSSSHRGKILLRQVVVICYLRAQKADFFEIRTSASNAVISCW